MSRLSHFARSSLRRFGLLRPPAPCQLPDILYGFDADIAPEHLSEGCRRLGVVPTGPIAAGWMRKSLGVAAVGPDGAQSWVKVSALHGVRSHPMRDAELASAEICGISKPALLNTCEWTQGDRLWLALQFSLSPSPTVETGYYAGATSARVGAPWIESLKKALDTLGKFETDRRSISINADQIHGLISERFGPGAEHVADDWRCAHGDLHWSNMTYPNLMLLDWEHWGLAPCGFDAANLLIYSCVQPALVRMIEEAFASDLDSRSGRVVRLALIARRFRDIEAGAVDPTHKPHLEAMARRVLAAR